MTSRSDFVAVPECFNDTLRENMVVSLTNPKSMRRRFEEMVSRVQSGEWTLSSFDVFFNAAERGADVSIGVRYDRPRAIPLDEQSEPNPPWRKGSDAEPAKTAPPVIRDLIFDDD